jgi:hypothetical protein
VPSNQNSKLFLRHEFGKGQIWGHWGIWKRTDMRALGNLENERYEGIGESGKGQIWGHWGIWKRTDMRALGNLEKDRYRGIHKIYSACPSQSLSHKLTMMEKCKYISCLLLEERLDKFVNALRRTWKTQTTAIIVIWGKPTAWVKRTLYQLCIHIQVLCLASNPWHRNRESGITHTLYVNLFPPLPFHCSALTEAWKSSCVEHSVLVIWGVYIAKIPSTTDGKILFRSKHRRGQRVRAGSVCYIVLLAHSCVIRDRDIVVVPWSQP